MYKLKEAIKHPRRVLSYIRIKTWIHLQRRVPFSYEQVADAWGTKGSHLPQFSVRLYHEVKLLEQALGCYHAKRSLEVGCGYGRLTPWITEHSNQHYAVEPEHTLLNSAKQLHPNVAFYNTRVQQLPFPDNYFDLCICWTVLMHIPPGELHQAIREMKRVCTPAAIIILAEGTGNRKGMGYWEHTLQEWRDLFSPWKLTWHIQRKIEATFKGDAGLVMRFESKKRSE